MPPVTPTRRTRSTPYSRSPSSSPTETHIFEPFDFVQCAFDVVHDYLAESQDHYKHILTKTDLVSLLKALNGHQILPAKSSLHQWLCNASVRQGLIYIGKTRRLVSINDLDSALASLRFSEQPAAMLDKAQRRFAGIPDELVRRWQQELVELAEMQKIWYALKDHEAFVPIRPRLEPPNPWAPSASTVVVASDSDDESDSEEDTSNGDDAEDTEDEDDGLGG